MKQFTQMLTKQNEELKQLIATPTVSLYPDIRSHEEIEIMEDERNKDHYDDERI